MNVKGQVVSVLPVQTGQGKNGEWVKNTYIIEMPGQYPKKVAVSIFGSTLPVLKVGQDVDCYIDIESREYNGRWYTEVKAYRVDFISGTVSMPAGGTTARTTIVTTTIEDPIGSAPDDNNDLPF